MKYGWVKSIHVFGMMVLKVQHEVALAEHRLLARSKRLQILGFIFRHRLPTVLKITSINSSSFNSLHH